MKKVGIALVVVGAALVATAAVAQAGDSSWTSSAKLKAPAVAYTLGDVNRAG